MSVIGRAGAHLSRVGNLRRLRAVTQTTVLRNISWMAFEVPDSALYQSPPSLQPKRPVAAEAVPSADGTGPSAQPITMAGRVGSPVSAVAGSQAAAASGKVVPASVPASAMRTGPMPLSQIQKRTFAGSDRPAVNLDPATPPREKSMPSRGGREAPTDNNPFPTLQLRIPAHPATWPVQLRRDDED
ncbi:hypothetical protein F5B21DRAFT_503236 [Xylaria acuta]|nr:hypothetical protein F5B21DRAFT_503236 [Xylaria acuta]